MLTCSKYKTLEPSTISAAGQLLILQTKVHHHHQLKRHRFEQTKKMNEVPDVEVVVRIPGGLVLGELLAGEGAGDVAGVVPPGCGLGQSLQQ